MRASIRADGMTFRPRCTSGPAETEDLDGMGETTGVPHKDVVGVGTTVETATRGLQGSPLPLEWTVISARPC